MIIKEQTKNIVFFKRMLYFAKKNDMIIGNQKTFDTKQYFENTIVFYLTCYSPNGSRIQNKIRRVFKFIEIIYVSKYLIKKDNIVYLYEYIHIYIYILSSLRIIVYLNVKSSIRCTRVFHSTFI